MALTVDSTSSGTTFTNTTSSSWSHTVGTKPLTGLFAMISLRDDGGGVGNNFSATYNSVAMTKFGELTDGTRGVGVCILYLATPSTGANTLAISWSGASLGRACAISVYPNMNGEPILSSSYTTTAVAQGTSLSISSIPTQPGNICIAVGAMQQTFSSSETITATGGQTDIMNGTVQRSVNMGYMAGYKASTGATDTISWSWTNPQWRLGAGASIKLAPSGTGLVVSPFMRFY